MRAADLLSDVERGLVRFRDAAGKTRGIDTAGVGAHGGARSIASLFSSSTSTATTSRGSGASM